MSNMIRGLEEEQAQSKLVEVRDSGDSGHATEEEEEKHMDVEEDEKPVEMEMVWGNVVKFVILHSLALWGVTLLPSLSLSSWAFLFITYQVHQLHHCTARSTSMLTTGCFFYCPPSLRGRIRRGSLHK